MKPNEFDYIRTAYDPARQGARVKADNMNVYIVTDEDGDQQREYPDAPPFAPKRLPVEVALDPGKWAMDEDDAAEMWAEEMWAHNDHPDEMIALVTYDGKTTRRVVTVESAPVFSASKA